jgi:hypothetical protein
MKTATSLSNGFDRSPAPRFGTSCQESPLLFDMSIGLPGFFKKKQAAQYLGELWLHS